MLQLNQERTAGRIALVCCDSREGCWSFFLSFVTLFHVMLLCRDLLAKLRVLSAIYQDFEHASQLAEGT
jgi:hypothetical protein